MAVILNSVFYVEAKANSDDYSIGDLTRALVTEIEGANGLAKERYSVSTGTSGSATGQGGAKACFLVADKAVTYLWLSASTSADSSSVSMPAGEPFFIPSGTTLPYATSIAARAAGVAADVTSISFYNGSGSTAVVRSYIVTEDA